MSADEGRAERGFTLIEVLVALAVFSLAALALLRLEGATIARTADLDEKMMAQLVARNLAVELLTDPTPPTLGSAEGTVSNGGRSYAWRRTASLTQDNRLVRIDIGVRTIGGTGGANGLSIVRPAGLRGHDPTASDAQDEDAS